MATITRRSFLEHSAIGLAAAPLLSSRSAVAANEKVTIGIIGCGGIGRVDLATFLINPEVECAILLRCR